MAIVTGEKNSTASGMQCNFPAINVATYGFSGAR